MPSVCDDVSEVGRCPAATNIDGPRVIAIVIIVVVFVAVAAAGVPFKGLFRMGKSTVAAEGSVVDDRCTRTNSGACARTHLARTSRIL